MNGAMSEEELDAILQATDPVGGRPTDDEVRYRDGIDPALAAIVSERRWRRLSSLGGGGGARGREAARFAFAATFAVLIVGVMAISPLIRSSGPDAASTVGPAAGGSVASTATLELSHTTASVETTALPPTTVGADRSSIPTAEGVVDEGAPTDATDTTDEEPCAARGPSLMRAREIYQEECSSPRVDCDEVGEEWVCADAQIGNRPSDATVTTG